MTTRRDKLLLLIPLVVVLVPFLIWPLVFGFFASFTDVAPGSTNVHWVGLANYLSVARDSSFVASWKNIAAFTVTAVPAELLLGLLIAYLLLEPFRGRGLVRVLLLVAAAHRTLERFALTA